MVGKIVNVGGKGTWWIGLADATVTLAQREQRINEMLEDLNHNCNYHGMKINLKKL